MVGEQPVAGLAVPQAGLGHAAVGDVGERLDVALAVGHRQGSDLDDAAVLAAPFRAQVRGPALAVEVPMGGVLDQDAPGPRGAAMAAHVPVLGPLGDHSGG